MNRFVRGLIGLAGFIFAWEAFSRSGLVRQQFLPPPSTVSVRLVQLVVDGDFAADVVATVLAWAIALSLAVAIAVPLGLLLGTVAAVRTASRAIVEFLRPVPAVSLIPLAVILLGTGPETKIALATYASVWPILFNTIYAMGEIDPLQTETARSFGLSRTRRLVTVALPHAAPFVMTGVRLSAAVALVVIISTELFAGGSGGIGQFIFLAGSGGARMDLVLAGTLVAGLFGCAVNAVLEYSQRRWLTWGGEADR